MSTQRNEAGLAATEPTRVVLTGGGTGGHVYPALAVAAALRQERPEISLLYIGGDRMETKVVPASGLAFRAIAVHGLSGDMPVLRRLRAAAELMVGLPLFQSRNLLRSFRPQVVIGTGGYVSGPVILAANMLKIPALALDGNRTPGWTSRAVARMVDVMAVAHIEMAEFFQPRVRRGASVAVTGLPIRAEVVTTTRKEGAAALGLDPTRFTMLILGGSLGSRRLNQAVAGALEELARSGILPPGSQLLHVVGQRYLAEAPSVAITGMNYRRIPFLREEYAQALAATDLLLSRAGASTVAEIAARGMPSILIPWAAASTGEQWLNAQPLAKAGAAVLIPDQELAADRLVVELKPLLTEPGRLERMGAAAKLLGMPRAAESIARLALRLADRRQRSKK